MKKFITILSIAFILTACTKKENRNYGVCYCQFFDGTTQEYDLNDLTRQEQKDKCNTHDNNASLFGGKCELD